jgi:hypothetical protein
LIRIKIMIWLDTVVHGFLVYMAVVDNVNAVILKSMQEEDHDKISEELEHQGELPKNPQQGGEEYENEHPRRRI